MSSFKFDNLSEPSFDKLAAPAYFLTDKKGKICDSLKKISWSSYFFSYLPSKIPMYLRRLGHLIMHFKWETNASLMNHIVKHLKSKEHTLLEKLEYREIRKIFRRLVSHTGLTEQAKSLQKMLKKAKPLKASQQPVNSPLTPPTGPLNEQTNEGSFEDSDEGSQENETHSQEFTEPHPQPQPIQQESDTGVLNLEAAAPDNQALKAMHLADLFFQQYPTSLIDNKISLTDIENFEETKAYLKKFIEVLILLQSYHNRVDFKVFIDALGPHYRGFKKFLEQVETETTEEACAFNQQLITQHLESKQEVEQWFLEQSFPVFNRYFEIFKITKQLGNKQEIDVKNNFFKIVTANSLYEQPMEKLASPVSSNDVSTEPPTFVRPNFHIGALLNQSPKKIALEELHTNIPTFLEKTAPINIETELKHLSNLEEIKTYYNEFFNLFNLLLPHKKESSLHSYYCSMEKIGKQLVLFLLKVQSEIDGEAAALNKQFLETFKDNLPAQVENRIECNADHIEWFKNQNPSALKAYTTLCESLETIKRHRLPLNFESISERFFARVFDLSLKQTANESNSKLVLEEKTIEVLEDPVSPIPTKVSAPYKAKEQLNKEFPRFAKEKLIQEMTDEEFTQYQQFLAPIAAHATHLKSSLIESDHSNMASYLLTADSIFQKAYQELLKACLELHSDFKVSDSMSAPIMDTSTGCMTCSYEQLQWASSILATSQGRLVKIAFEIPYLEINQRILISRALQVVLGGSEAENAPLPKYEFCFHLSFEANESQPVIDNERFLKDGSYAWTQFTALKSDTETHIHTNRERFQELFFQFWKDWNREGIEITIQDASFKSNARKNNALCKKIKTTYSKYLTGLSKQELQTLILQRQNCPLVKAALQSFSEVPTKKEFETSYLPKSIFKAMCATFSGGEFSLYKMFNQLSFDPQVLSKLIDHTGYSQKDLEPLLRLNLLYIMCYTNQSTSVPLMHLLKPKTDAYLDPTEIDGLNTASRLQGSEFIGSDAYIQLKVQDERRFTIDESFNSIDFEFTTHCQYGPNAPGLEEQVFATGSTVLKIRGDDQSHSTAVYQPFKELYFNHLISEPILAHLTASTHTKHLLNILKAQLVQLDTYTSVKPSVWSWGGLTNWTGWTEEDSTFNSQIREIEILLYAIRSSYHSIRMASHSPEITLTNQSLLKNVSHSIEQIESKLTQLDLLTQPAIKKVYRDIKTIFNKWDNAEEFEELSIIDSLDFKKEELEFMLKEHEEEITSAQSSKSKEEFDEYLIELFRTYKKDIAKTLEAEKVVSEKDKCEWKIVKYEKMISSLQSGIYNLMKELHIPQEMLLKEQAEDAPPALKAASKLVQEILQFQIMENSEERYTIAYLDKVREVYSYKFIDNLREAVQSLESEEDNDFPGLRQFIHRICEHRIANINLDKEMDTLIGLFSQVGQQELEKKSSSHSNIEMIHDEIDESATFVDGLHILNQRIKSVPSDLKVRYAFDISANSMRGHFNTFFDGGKQANFPQHLYDLHFDSKEKNKKVKMLAFGSPTIENSPSYASIAPEFKGFLRSYKESNKKHLYVSHQNFLPVSSKGWKKILATFIPFEWWKNTVETVMGGDETNRSKAIMSLQEQEFKDTFYAITLSRNSDFYYQKSDKTEAASVYTNFKLALMAEYFEKSYDITGNYLSDEVKTAFKSKLGEDLDVWAATMSDNIHRLLFRKKEKLKAEDRKIFNKIFQTLLISKLTQVLDVDSVNTSCKDCIDRGAESFSTLFGMLLTLNDQETDQEMRKFHEKLVCARALMVRKRPIIEERFESHIETMDFVLLHKKELKKLFALYFETVPAAAPSK